MTDLEPQLIRFALHGGAGDMPPKDHGYVEQQQAMREIAERAQAALIAGTPALDVVQQAVEALEDCPLFNAGHGAVLNREGVAELDAAIMDGDGRAGAVGACQRVRNPVQLARALLDDGRHVMFAGPNADAAAQRHGIALADPAYFVTELRATQQKKALASNRIVLDHDEPFGDAKGTVGAVARDGFGNLAAATSTGGMTNKIPGRVGDSPIIGAGTWANNATCAVSATGHGESYIRANLAAQMHWRMALAGASLQAAADEALEDVREIGGTGGLIAIAANGDIVLPHTTTGMFRASFSADGAVATGALD